MCLHVCFANDYCGEEIHHQTGSCVASESLPKDTIQINHKIDWCPQKCKQGLYYCTHTSTCHVIFDCRMLLSFVMVTS